MALQGLSIYSSGDEYKTDATFCASTLFASIFAPHDALAKFLRSFPFFGKPFVEVACWIFAGNIVPFTKLAAGVSDGTLLRFAVSPFSI